MSAEVFRGEEAGWWLVMWEHHPEGAQQATDTLCSEINAARLIPEWNRPTLIS